MQALFTQNAGDPELCLTWWLKSTRYNLDTFFLEKEKNGKQQLVGLRGVDIWVIPIPVIWVAQYLLRKYLDSEGVQCRNPKIGKWVYDSKN